MPRSPIVRQVSSRVASLAGNSSVRTACARSRRPRRRSPTRARGRGRPGPDCRLDVQPRRLKLAGHCVPTVHGAVKGWGQHSGTRPGASAREWSTRAAQES